MRDAGDRERGLARARAHMGPGDVEDEVHRGRSIDAHAAAVERSADGNGDDDPFTLRQAGHNLDRARAADADLHGAPIGAVSLR